MRRIRGFWCALLVVASAAFAAHAANPYIEDGGFDPDTPERRGQAGMTWLQVGGSARAEGMGGAHSAVRGEPLAIFYNPAGVADVKGTAVAGTHSRYSIDLAMNHFAAMTSAWGVVFGASFASMDYGSIPHTRVADPDQGGTIWGYEIIGDIEPTATAAGVFLASRLTDRFSVGVQAKYAIEDYGMSDVYSFTLAPQRDEDGVIIGSGRGYLENDDGTIQTRDNRVAAILWDLGTQYNTGLRGFTINMAFLNYGSAQEYVEGQFDPPLTYRVGFSFEAIEMITGYGTEENRFMIYGEGIENRDVLIDMAVGVEYLGDFDFVDVGLRAGRRASRNQEGSWSFGGSLGLQLASFHARFDYSYSDYGPDITMQKLGVVLDLR